MVKFISPALLVLLLFSSCSDKGNPGAPAPTILGCMKVDACNYNPDATSEDGITCFYAVDIDCIDFVDDIQPILTSKCTICHGVSGGLTLSSYEDLMLGGNSGFIVIPGDVEENSILYKRISGVSIGDRMPQSDPTYFDSNVDELNLIRDWIEEGANP